MARRHIDCEILVVGSGPGGATTACLLAEAGLDVLLIEEGGRYGQDSAPPFSLEEIDQKYRNGGLTPTFGKTQVTYIEGCCVGGGSEINAALCHLPPASMLDEWRERYGLESFGAAELEPYFEAVQREIPVARFPFELDPASRKLQEGAEKMGWASEEVPRFWSYPPGATRERPGTQQSMTETLIPRALAAGCRLLPRTWARRILIHGGRARAVDAIVRREDGTREKLRIHFCRLFLCAGPIQTPTLLQRSGVRGNVGRGFTLHPMVRIAARYAEFVNDHTYGVPVQQVVEFKPEITLGCSHSSLPHLAMWLGGEVEDRETKLREWQKMAVFYVLVKGAARGAVRNLPGFDEAFVTYPIGEEDMRHLGEGLYLLGKLLFSTGAVEIFNPIAGSPAFRSLREMEPLRSGIPHGRVTVSTIHLFSTCAMGGDPERSVVDSWGRVHGFENIWINDAGILPEATGVNPQVTLLALARRNVEHWLENR
jgi:choline dehydrogenase-like flavoprotein